MKLHAFAALLAMPMIGFAAQTAKADYYCCSGHQKSYEFVTEDFYVVKDAVVFGCDGYHCETNIKIIGDIHIKARCRNGWCEIQSVPFKNAWVLESGLKRVYESDSRYRGHHSGHHGASYDDRPEPEPEPDYGQRY